jgi:hypothetical protein
MREKRLHLRVRRKGDSMKHRHNWVVEPATQSRMRDDGEMDGELYTPQCRRGNLQGSCKCGAERRFHPFAGGALLYGSLAPAFDLALAVKPELVTLT